MVDCQPINRKTVRDRTYYLVRLQYHAAVADSWEPAEHIANCPGRTRLPHPAAPSPSALRVRRSPSRLCHPPCSGPAPLNPRPAGRWRPRVRGLGSALLPDRRGLEA